MTGKEKEKEREQERQTEVEGERAREAGWGYCKSNKPGSLLKINLGKKKIDEGDSANLELEEEIEELAKKLIELQKGSKMKGLEIQNCINFDRQASLLQKQLKKYNEMQGGNCVKETAEGAAVTLPFNSTREGKMKGHGSSRRTARFTDVELLKRKVEGLSKGKLLKRMEEEYGYMLSAAANYTVPNSASTSKQYELPDSSSFHISNPHSIYSWRTVCTVQCFPKFIRVTC